MVKQLNSASMLGCFILVLLIGPSAQAQKKVADYLFHKVIEGKPLPITRVGPDADLNPEGFALYREGSGGYEQYRKLVCELGVSEIYVLSANGALENGYNQQLAHEDASRPCPHGNKQVGITVKYGLNASDNQLVKNPLTPEFLKKYDRWVLDAKKKGKKIAFRCNCGCHRTGRLAGYSEMKFFDATPEQALRRMKNAFDSDQEGVEGKFFARKWKRGTLNHQIVALNDYIHHKPCSTDPEYCVPKVSENGNKPDPTDRDPDDLLPTDEQKALDQIKSIVDHPAEDRCEP